MADPSEKAPELTSFLEEVASRSTSIKSDVCVPAPFGCGKPVDPPGFRNELSRREYTISGLCQACQDSVFGSMGDDDDDA
jgi:hypothetical protein